MGNVRITEAPVAPIWHRPRTVLTAPRRCHQGHEAPGYVSAGNSCVICCRDRALGWREPGQEGRPVRARSQVFADYATARQRHEEIGGWLLDFGGGLFGVTDNLNIARRLRGQDWLENCERRQCWDEIEIAKSASG